MAQENNLPDITFISDRLKKYYDEIAVVKSNRKAILKEFFGLSEDEITDEIELSLESMIGTYIAYSKDNSAEILDEIKAMPYFDKYEAKVYVTDAEIDHCEEAVWNLLKQVDMVNNSAFEDLLGKKMDFCTICAMPVKNSFLLKVYFVVLNSKMRMSQMNFK